MHRKTMYVDGHERDDVVKDRVRYIHELQAMVKFMCRYSGDNMDEVTEPSLGDGDREVVLIVHDEMVAHQNDGEDWSYQTVSTRLTYSSFLCSPR